VVGDSWPCCGTARGKALQEFRHGRKAEQFFENPAAGMTKMNTRKQQQKKEATGNRDSEQ